MSWELVRRLPGGYQQGAYELRDQEHRRGVLKVHMGHLPPKRFEATAQAIEEARLRGWPTPRWLAHGSLPNDGGYIIEDYVEGERPRRLDGAVLERLLEALLLQADARPNTDQDWSAYIHRVVFAGEAELAARMRARPETAILLRRLEQLTAAARDLSLPAHDLVHGDFVLNNVVVRDEQPYLVDTAHAGTGTRGYDLATLLMETTVGGDYAAPSLADQRRLERECVAIIGRLGFLVCIACRIMHLLVFGGVHWGAEVPQTVAKCHAFLDSLESTQAERT
jgi:fructosamine-3-kinase